MCSGEDVPWGPIDQGPRFISAVEDGKVMICPLREELWEVPHGHETARTLGLGNNTKKGKHPILAPFAEIPEHRSKRSIEPLPGAKVSSG